MLESLSKTDALKLLEYVESTISFNLQKNIFDHMMHLSSLFSFDKIVCTYSPLADYLSPDMKFDFFATNLADEFMEIYINNDYHLTDPVVTEYFASFNLINWETLTSSLYTDKNDALDFSEQAGLLDGFTYGTFSPVQNKHTVFLWGGKSVEYNNRTIAIIKYITPFLSELIKKNHSKQQKKWAGITPKEIDVLNWLKEGKSSWEIGIILKISERTVNFHINNLKTKLGASNRAHCVAIAFDLGLIHL